MQYNKPKNLDTLKKYLINSRIREFCKLENLIQADLERLGINKSTVHMVWKDKQLPGVEFIQKMAINFESLNIYWLLTGKGIILNEEKEEEEKNKFRRIDKKKEVVNSNVYIKKQKEIDRLRKKLTNIQEKYISLLEELYRMKGECKK